MLDKKTVNKIRKILFTHLDPKKAKAFIFGSWAEEKARRFSDIDIGIESKHPLPLIEIEEAFENSDLPYLVETVNFRNVSSQFKKIAKRKIIPLN